MNFIRIFIMKASDIIASTDGDGDQVTSAFTNNIYTFDNEKCRFETYAGALSTWSILFSARYFF